MWCTSRDLGHPVRAQAGDDQPGTRPGCRWPAPARRRAAPGPVPPRGARRYGCPRPSRTISFTNMNRPSKMFSVISDEPVADRGQPDRHRQQVGGETRVRQGDDVHGPRAGRPSVPGSRRRRRRPPPPAETSLSSAISRNAGPHAVHRHVAAGHRRAERPGAGRRSGPRPWCAAPARSAVDALDRSGWTCPRRRSGRPSR